MVLNPAATTAQSTPGFSFGASAQGSLTTTTTSVTPAFSLLASKPSTTASTSFSLGQTGISFGITPSTASGASALGTAQPAFGTAATATTPASSGSQTMHYRLLEESVNKWKLELEEHEAAFLRQATQVNAWDRLLIANGEKIAELSELVERLKLDQQRLDHELDFIASQQGELAELLEPLERAVRDAPALSLQQHADLEREHTYHLAENVNAQLKRMSQDIKEIIEHLNSANAAVVENKPVFQISKILNAHMDALTWIQQNSALLQRKIEEVERSFQQHDQDKFQNR